VEVCHRAAAETEPQRELRATRRRQGDTKSDHGFNIGLGRRLHGSGASWSSKRPSFVLVDSSLWIRCFGRTGRDRDRRRRVALVDLRAHAPVKNPTGISTQAGQRRAQPSRDREGDQVDRVHHGGTGPPRWVNYLAVRPIIGVEDWTPVMTRPRAFRDLGLREGQPQVRSINENTKESHPDGLPTVDEAVSLGKRLEQDDVPPRWLVAHAIRRAHARFTAEVPSCFGASATPAEH